MSFSAAAPVLGPSVPHSYPPGGSSTIGLESNPQHIHPGLGHPTPLVRPSAILWKTGFGVGAVTMAAGFATIGAGIQARAPGVFKPGIAVLAGGALLGASTVSRAVNLTDRRTESSAA